MIVDYTTGKVVKTTAITEGDDFTAAQSQTAAMAKAKSDLKTAVNRAVAGTAGSRGVSVIPTLKDNRVTASVTLVKGDQSKTVEERLK